jgi:hypothetical protein
MNWLLSIDHHYNKNDVLQEEKQEEQKQTGEITTITTDQVF